jgi:hypothetical protein
MNFDDPSLPSCIMPIVKIDEEARATVATCQAK